MNDVFISYRREDTADICGRIYDRLELLIGAKRVFKDVDNIPPGVDFREHINSALNRCTAALVVIGPKWLSATNANGQRRIDDPNDFVRIEIEGLLRRNIPVIPVLVYGATMPGSTDLPPAIAALAYRNAVVVRSDPDFRRDMEHAVAALRANSVKQVQGPLADTRRQGASSPVLGTQWSGRAWIVFIESVALLLLAGAVVVVADTQEPGDYAVFAVTLVCLSIVLSYVAAFVSLTLVESLRRPGWTVALLLALVLVIQPGIVGYIFALANPAPGFQPPTRSQGGPAGDRGRA